MPRTNYQIPKELTRAFPNELLMVNKPIEPKMVFLERNEEKFFLNFPAVWEKPLDEALGNIYDNGNSRYTFSIMSYDGKAISSQRVSMFGMEFKTYLAGLLKTAKTIALYIFNGLQVYRFIICRP